MLFLLTLVLLSTPYCDKNQYCSNNLKSVSRYFLMYIANSVTYIFFWFRVFVFEVPYHLSFGVNWFKKTVRFLFQGFFNVIFFPKGIYLFFNFVLFPAQKNLNPRGHICSKIKRSDSLKPLRIGPYSQWQSRWFLTIDVICFLPMLSVIGLLT